MSQEVNRINNNFTEKDNITYPIIDAHMHIQGNQIAPIPIMKGVLLVQISNMICETSLNGQINFQELSYLEDGEKEDYGMSDKVTSLLNKLINNRTSGLDYFLLENRRRLLDLLGSDISKRFVEDYGKIAKFASIDVAKLYFSYLENESKNLYSIGYPSHKKSYTEFYKKNEIEKATEDMINLAKKNHSDLFTMVAGHYLTGTQASKFQFSIMHGMELMYSHYWGAAGIPIYVFDDKGKLFYITNSTCYNSRPDNNISVFAHNIYDSSDIILKKLGINLNKKQEKNGHSNYIHFMKKVRDDEVYQFEDHEQHVAMQKLTALSHPLNILPFYHVDLRRFFAPIESILENHYFLKYASNKKYDSEDMYKQFDHKENKIYERGRKKILGFELKNHFDEIKNFFVTTEKGTANSLFWGIKMYVALGYPPYYLLDIDQTKKVFPMLKDIDLTKAHDEVEEFYRFCIEKDIPITCHGSPQGMTIADPGVYLKEYLKTYKDKNGNSLMDNYLALWTKQPYTNCIDKPNLQNFPILPQTFLSGLGLIDDFSSPKSWRKVLEYRGLDKLRVCIAHFGGSRFFDGTFKSLKDQKKAFYQWKDDISDLIKDYPNVYTDISCFTFKVEKGEKIIDEIQWEYLYYEEKNVRGILSRLKDYCTNFDENKPKDIYYRIYKTAENLAALLRRNENLRYRIMYGTDWPMFETNEKMDRYKSNMFLVLQFVTAMLDNEWDAWHQFAVINPLLFLNLIEKKEKGYVFSDTGKHKLEQYFNSIESANELTNLTFLAEKCGLSCEKISQMVTADDLSNIHESISKWYNDDYIIPDASNILLDDNESLRLTGYRKGEKW